MDGGLADNLGMRAALEVLEAVEALSILGQPTPLDHVRRIIVFVVNSRSSPETHWDEVERAPGNVALLIKATGVPIDHYSYEAVEQLKDTVARWQTMRRIRDSATLPGNRDPELAELARAPDIDLHVIDVSFAALEDKAEIEYLNNLPTSFVLPPEAVDRLRAAAKTIILLSPEFQQVLKSAGAKLVIEPVPAAQRGCSMNSTLIAVTVFIFVFGGALAGVAIRVPAHHQNDETKDVVKLVMGLVATISALVLSLLIASAHGSYDTQESEVQQLSAQLVLLDEVFVHYGPETNDARAQLRRMVTAEVARLWPDAGADEQPCTRRKIMSRRKTCSTPSRA